MNKYFSPATKGFYILGVNKIIPDDAVIVSDEVYQHFAGFAWPEGKVLGANNSGIPAWVKVPPLTHKEAVAATDVQKQALIDQASDYINSRQWPGKAAIGRLKGDELGLYNEWLDYLDALEAVDATTAPDIVWPIKPDI